MVHSAVIAVVTDRIGEILAATRAELVLPCDSAPGTSFAHAGYTAAKDTGPIRKASGIM